MKIGFIGQGWIGKNLANDFEERGYDVIRYALEPPYNKNKDKIKDCDITFIAVPTPSTPDGFSYKILENVLELIGENKIAVIKSTVLPEVTNILQDKNPNIYLLHSPEFLTEATAVFDTKNPDRNIIGIPVDNAVYKDKAQKVLDVLPYAPYKLICSAKEAAFVKYGGNCWFYFKVLFINMFYDLVKEIDKDISWESIKDALAADYRIGRTHLDPIHKSGRGAGGHCLLPDTKIITNKGVKNIKDIEIDEKVLTHKGKFEKVLKISKRKINDLIYRIKGQGLQPFYVTDEHPIYSAISDRKYNGIKKKKLSNCKISDLKIKFNKPNKLKNGDYMAFPKFSNNNINSDIKGLNRDLCRLAGYYVAEGSFDKKRITFAFHINEKEYHSDVIKLVKNLYGLDTKIENRVDKNTTVLKVYSTKLVKDFERMFGHRAENKHFPNKWLLAKDDLIKEMLNGYCRGDGSFSMNVFTSATVSEKLDSQLRLMLYRLGIKCNSFHKDEKIDKTGQYHQKAYYICCSNIIETRKMSDIVGYKLNKKVKWIRNTCPELGNNILRPIKEIDNIKYNGYVYNLKVEKDNSYVGLDGSFHNCFIKDFEAFKDLYEDKVADVDGMQVLNGLVQKNIKYLMESNKDLDLLSSVYGKKIESK